MTAIAPPKEWVLQQSRQRLEPNWLRDLRLQSLAAFEQAQGVDRGEEERQKRAGSLAAPIQLSSTQPYSFPMESFFQNTQGHSPHRVVFANHKIATHCLDAHLAEQGVLFTDLSFAVRLFPKLVQPYLGQLLPFRQNKWIALQTALWSAGLFLYVPKGVQIEVPMQAWWQRTQAGGHLHPRLLVVADEDSRVTLLTGEVSRLEGDAFSLQATEVVAKERAQVRIVSLQEQDAKNTRFAFQKAQAARGAQVEWLFADLGEGHSVVEATTTLAGPEAQGKMQGLFLGAKQQHLDLTLTSEHLAKSTSSHIQTRGIVTDKARALTRAVSQIAKGAVGTISRQEEKRILLSKQAQAQAVPMLLIAEEDVNCDHALSVGPIREDHLFYLQSRGLSKADAQKLLLTSFLAPVVDHWPLQGLLPLLEDWLERMVAP